MNENVTCFVDLLLHVPILTFCELQLAGCLGVLWLGPIPYTPQYNYVKMHLQETWYRLNAVCRNISTTSGRGHKYLSESSHLAPYELEYSRIP
jgi:hypothetical protein